MNEINLVSVLGTLTSSAPDSEERRLDRAEKRWPDDHHPCSKRARSETEPESKLRDIAILDAVVALYNRRVAASSQRRVLIFASSTAARKASRAGAAEAAPSIASVQEFSAAE